jgi:hypothetical protein
VLFQYEKLIERRKSNARQFDADAKQLELLMRKFLHGNDKPQ